MAGKNTAAFGIYSNRIGVENAVDRLKMEGYRNTDISVLFPENVGTKDFAHEKNTKAPEGATTGAGAGVIVGGTLGWLAGIGSRAIYRSGSDHGRTGRCRRWWDCWRTGRRPGWNGHTGVRGQAL